MGKIFPPREECPRYQETIRAKVLTSDSYLCCKRFQVDPERGTCRASELSQFFPYLTMAALLIVMDRASLACRETLLPRLLFPGQGRQGFERPEKAVIKTVLVRARPIRRNYTEQDQSHESLSFVSFTI